jgi:hypothetical protein
MSHLTGGPFYEISFLIKNQLDPNVLLELLLKLTVKGRIRNAEEKGSISDKIKLFTIGWDYGDGLDKIVRTFETDVFIDVAGTRKSRLFVKELSQEYIVINFWFLGTKATSFDNEDDGIHNREKHEFRVLFYELLENIDTELVPVLGTIAYEVDCEDLFDSPEGYPSDFFTEKNLSVTTIKKALINGVNDYELCWLNPKFFESIESEGIILDQVI